EALSAEGAIVLSPPDLLFRRMLVHNKLIRGCTSGMLPCVDDERTQVRERSLGPEDALFIERWSWQIPIHAPKVHESMVLQAIGTGQLSGLLRRGRLNVKINVHSHSLSSLRSPR